VSCKGLEGWELGARDCGFRIADCGLEADFSYLAYDGVRANAECGIRNAEWRRQIADFGLRIADWREGWVGIWDLGLGIGDLLWCIALR
jgi:hypothetical protein